MSEKQDKTCDSSSEFVVDDNLPNREEFLFKLKHEGLTREEHALATDPELFSIIMENLDKTLKHDRAVKSSVFATGISSFLRDPLNLYQKGPSGVGKTYSTNQALQYFVGDYVWFIAGLSPKSLIHDYGMTLTEDGKLADDIERPEKPKKLDCGDQADYFEELKVYKEENKKYIDIMRKTHTLIDLRGKIIVFLQAPERDTFEMLFPVLSHDREECHYKFVDRAGRGGPMRTMNVILKGWPAFVFLSVEKDYVEEAATRGFTVTPEITSEKLADANKLTNEKNAFPWKFDESEETKKIKKVIGAIREWFETTKADVIIPFENLNDLFPAEIVRDMRDFSHFEQFLKTITAIHVFQRPRLRVEDKLYVMTTLSDIFRAYTIYSEVFETTRTGTDKTLLDFFHNVMEQQKNWYLKNLTEEYNAISPKKASSETMRRYLGRLEEIGYVTDETDPNDKRRNIYHPLTVKAKLSTNSHNNELCLDDLSKLQNGFETWLDKSTHGQVKHDNTFLSADLTDRSLTLEELKQAILEPQKTMLLAEPSRVVNSIGINESSTDETEPKSNHKEPMCQIVDNSANAEFPKKENIVCGHCKKWHTGACSFPGDPNCIAPTNPYAKQCGSYVEHES